MPADLPIGTRVRVHEGEGVIRARDGDDYLVRLEGAERSGHWLGEELEVIGPALRAASAKASGEGA